MTQNQTSSFVQLQLISECRTQAAHLTQIKKSENTEKRDTEEKEEMEQLSAATYCSSSGNNILLFVYVTPVSKNAEEVSTVNMMLFHWT